MLLSKQRAGSMSSASCKPSRTDQLLHHAFSSTQTMHCLRANREPHLMQDLLAYFLAVDVVAGDDRS